MTQDACRSIGAIVGLAIGLGLMVAVGLGGMIPGFLFGAGGAVAAEESVVKGFMRGVEATTSDSVSDSP